MLLAVCEQFTLFYKGSACKSSANLDDIAVSKTPVYLKDGLRRSAARSAESVGSLLVPTVPWPCVWQLAESVVGHAPAR